VQDGIFLETTRLFGFLESCVCKLSGGAIYATQLAYWFDFIDINLQDHDLWLEIEQNGAIYATQLAYWFDFIDINLQDHDLWLEIEQNASIFIVHEMRRSCASQFITREKE